MIDVDQTYAGLAHAETGAFKDPYIRTTASNTPKGSTAFGPVQITGTLAADVAGRGKLSPDSKQFYNQVMAPKYDAMLKHGNNANKIPDYNPNYDYGGNAEFDPSVHGQDYEQFAKEVISDVASRSGGDEGKFLEKWRGKTSAQDPAYWQRYNQGKKIFVNEVAR